MDKNSFDQDLAERITLNAVLASRVYLKDTKRFKENLTEIDDEHHFAVGIDKNVTFNEQYNEALAAELFTYFSPIGLEELLENTKNPDLKMKNFIMTENPSDPNEFFYYSDKFIIKYTEGVYKIAPNTNSELISFWGKMKDVVNFGYSYNKLLPKELITYLKETEPRFSFGVFTSREDIKDENDKTIDVKRTFHIAFRGTEPDIKENENKKSFLKKLVSNNFFELSKYFVVDYPNMAHHYEFLKPFVKEAIKLSNDAQIPNMEITGHSLGGAMVDVFLADNENNPDLAHKNYKGYAFGNPFGNSTRNKIERFMKESVGPELKKVLSHFVDKDEEKSIKEISKKVKNSSKAFLNIGTHTGLTLGCALTGIQNNDMIHHQFDIFKNKLNSFVYDTYKVTEGITLAAASTVVRFAMNMNKLLLKPRVEATIIDENFKKVDEDSTKNFISVQHVYDPVANVGPILYEARGDRYLVKDKNQAIDKDNKEVDANGFLGINNHKAFNYVVSCVQRVNYNRNSSLAQAIRNVNHTFEEVAAHYPKKYDGDTRDVIKNVKSLRNRNYNIHHSVDKQIPI